MTIKTRTVLACLTVATLTAGVSVAEARGRGISGGRGIAVGERHPGGFGHHGGFHHRFHRHGFHGYGFGYPAGGYFLSSYGGCEWVFSRLKGRHVRVCG